MNRIKAFAKENLPKPVVRFLRRLISGRNREAGKSGGYLSIKVTDDDLEQGGYKKHLGGGADSWESRGAFQLFFLREMGLVTNSKILDVGCGPGRASKYLIGFLEAANYHGVDYNVDFIKAARAMAEKNELVAKNPSFDVVQDFNLGGIETIFDYAMAFSVLNHCSVSQREAFFGAIPASLSEGGKVYITHASWFDESYLYKTGMRLTNQFSSDDFDITEYGWETKGEIFPIIELTKG